MVARIDDRKDYGEIRWVALGDWDGTTVVLVYTEEEDTVRLISARVTKNETNIYYKKIYHL
ncbi:MAG: BrnT family toxin [Desulfobulbaceae bacterium]|nr:BrnT family toxin [Desulfobulbaceae bacterium]